MTNHSTEINTTKGVKKTPFVIKLATILISMVLIVYIAIIGKSILLPLILGLLIALLLVPMTRFFEQKLRFPIIVSSLVSPILFTLGVLLVLFLIGTQMAKFREDWDLFQTQMVNLFHQTQNYIYTNFGVSEEEQMQYLSGNVETLLQRSSTIAQSVLSSLTSILITASFVFLSVFFLLLYRSHLVKFLTWCFPVSQKTKVMKVTQEIQSVVKQYIFGLMIQVVIVTVLMFIAYSIIGIKYALLFAVLCGVLNLIPYIGIFTATAMATIVTYTTGTPIQALWVIISVVIVNSIDGNIIMPKIVGSKVSLNSFVVLFGILIAEAIWGLAGMFLAIPLMAMFKIICDNVEGMRPYGFLLGEDDEKTPKYDAKYITTIECVKVEKEVLEEEEKKEKE
ncbi:AI-2E family transporter [Capnocytophaga sp. ARDL2]|uniref:AI-2E family transporter n=1 Tax=Capnocytophaga sp. ARDL2 TaxID=3238809 RepID=UPI0035574202